MKAKPRRSNPPTTGTGSFTDIAAEYSCTKDHLCRLLEKVGGYEPAIDDIHIDQIVRTFIQLRTCDTFLSQNTANEDTYTRIADAKTKLSKIMMDSIDQLALSRRIRLDNKTKSIKSKCGTPTGNQNACKLLMWQDDYDLSSANGIRDFLSEVVTATWTGALGTRAAGVLNGSLRLLLEVCEFPELEKRIVELEKLKRS